jgi:hypothetical protein
LQHPNSLEIRPRLQPFLRYKSVRKLISS